MSDGHIIEVPGGNPNQVIGFLRGVGLDTLSGALAIKFVFHDHGSQSNFTAHIPISQIEMIQKALREIEGEAKRLSVDPTDKPMTVGVIDIGGIHVPRAQVDQSRRGKKK